MSTSVFARCTTASPVLPSMSREKKPPSWAPSTIRSTLALLGELGDRRGRITDGSELLDVRDAELGEARRGIGYLGGVALRRIDGIDRASAHVQDRRDARHDHVGAAQPGELRAALEHARGDRTLLVADQDGLHRMPPVHPDHARGTRTRHRGIAPVSCAEPTDSSGAGPQRTSAGSGSGPAGARPLTAQVWPPRRQTPRDPSSGPGTGTVPCVAAKAGGRLCRPGGYWPSSAGLPGRRGSVGEPCGSPTARVDEALEVRDQTLAGEQQAPLWHETRVEAGLDVADEVVVLGADLLAERDELRDLVVGHVGPEVVVGDAERPVRAQRDPACRSRGSGDPARC